MYIKKLQVFNYKSYSNSGSGEMEFSPGINIIVGKNNAGKTSLLEVLTLDFENQPHRSLKTLPNKTSTIEKKSRIEITLHLGKGEWRSFIQYMSPNIGIPIPSETEEYRKSLNLIDNKYREPYIGLGSNHDLIEKDKSKIHREFCIEHLIKLQSSLDDNNQETKISLYTNKQMDDMSLTKLVNFDTYEVVNSKKFLQVAYNTQDKEFHLSKENQDENDNFQESIGYSIFDIFVSRIYRFKAERLNIGVCKFENNDQLKSDASNLAESICILQGKNPGMFANFNNLVSTVLPEIKWISVLPRDNSDVEIKVWTLDTQLNRDDLSLPLSSCGSGIGQVLAIVYILVCSEEPRTLIIDEPQSFLHPGAAKKLIETIKQFPQHQYFIATHSPDIITTADPSNIIKLKYENCETTASVINAKEIKSQNELLEELGVRLSDVFGADNILWVEGKTEQICFPKILEKVLKKQLRGTKILGVMNTADFQGKRASLIFDIYQKLSGGTDLFPPAIGFLFDSENRTEEEKDKWQRQSGKPVEFLSRRMYENYLLDSEAIAAVFNEDNQSRPEPLPINLTSVEVEEWLNQKKQEQELSETEWLSTVDGSQLLTELFRELSGSKLTFHKTREPYNHSYKLTKWLVENKPGFLSGLAEEIANMLNYEERSHRQP
ncbi:AAA family ATPase [Anabaena catenula]|uniref:AAA family ATPase n=1 Tax=Anabaena catenula FACHB-362 TaxID=2692877 RepID=A0ABR8JAQ6_9NOST|nr:AAA family ATPase [Anabaena catenula]MBD2694504.1 AAA family ATPase [Anabaena catenula FACHB-362]